MNSLNVQCFCFRNSIADILKGEDVCAWDRADDDLKQEMARMAAASAWGRSEFKMGSILCYLVTVVSLLIWIWFSLLLMLIPSVVSAYCGKWKPFQ